MPTNFYDTQDTMLVDEDFGFAAHDDIDLGDLAELFVDEDEENADLEDLENATIVVLDGEDEGEHPTLRHESGLGSDMIPGSEVLFVEEEEPEVEQKAKDWENDKDPGQFVMYVKDKLNKIPRHSGETVPGCERAKSFLRSIDSEISKAMRSDLDGIIDEVEIDGIRKSIEDMVERLDKQIKKLRGTKKASLDVRLVSEGHCNKCEASAPMWHDIANDSLVCMSCEAETIRKNDGLEKTAGTPVINVYVSAFERAIVGTMINSKVSAGRNIEETYEKLKNKYNFTPREELAIQQLVADYGYPVYKDRGLLNEPADPAAGDGVDFQTNYQA